MELNITHLQHYPIGGENALRLMHNDANIILVGVQNYNIIDVHIRDAKYSDSICPVQVYLKDCKPLLLPLSALYEEIDEEIGMKVIGEMLGYDLSKYVDNDGDIFYGFYLTDKSIPHKIPMEDREIYFIYFDTNLKWFYMVNQWLEPDDCCECIPFNLEVSSYLDSNHYDWRYGLIDKGLAIDKRSVN